MEKQWHARRKNNPGRQKKPAAKNPDFNCICEQIYMNMPNYNT